MIDLLDASFAPFGWQEAVALATAGRAPPAYEELLRSLLRVQFIRAALGSSLGVEVAWGLDAADRAASLALVARPSADRGRFDAKAVALRARLDHPAATACDVVVEAMLRAGLERDRRLLEGARRHPRVAWT